MADLGSINVARRMQNGKRQKTDRDSTGVDGKGRRRTVASAMEETEYGRSRFARYRTRTDHLLVDNAIRAII